MRLWRRHLRDRGVPYQVARETAGVPRREIRDVLALLRCVIDPEDRFYFVHSYYAAPDRDGDVAGITDYIVGFTSVVARDNLFATQFHPEKSQRPGLQLLDNFLRWKP